GPRQPQPGGRVHPRLPSVAGRDEAGREHAGLPPPGAGDLIEGKGEGPARIAHGRPVEMDHFSVAFGTVGAFSPRGWRRMASTLVRALAPGFRETRWRMPVGS